MAQLATGPKSEGGRKAALPKWLTAHFENALDAQQQLMQITRLSAQGIAMHRARPQALRALAKADGKPDGGDAEELESAEKDAELAQQEIDRGFPVLHGLATIGLWSWLEDFTKGLVEGWFLHRRASMSAPAVQKLRVRLGDYIQLTKAEQAHFLVEMLEQELAGPLKQGLGRFNCLLEVIGLNVSLSDSDAKALFELQQVRNNLAHRNGRVDARLRGQCPWLKLRVGSELRISTSMFVSYANASGAFLLELLYQTGDQLDVDLRDGKAKRGIPHSV